MTTNSPPAGPSQWELIVNSVEPEFTMLAETGGNLVAFAKESRFAIEIIQASDALQKCPTESIRRAVRSVATIGLSLNPAMKLAYLVPRKGQCCLDIGWRGLVKIAVDAGSIQGAKALIVRQNDVFEWRGSFKEPLHDLKFKTREERGPVIGVYSTALLPSGACMVELMDMDEIDEVRRLSGTASKPDSPWNKWFEAMCKKSVKRRAAQDWTPTERLAAALEVMNDADEIDITPGAPQLPRPGRLDPAAIAATADAEHQQKQPQADADQRKQALADLVKRLETEVVPNGSNAYTIVYKERMNRAQRQLLGTDEHNRLWKLALEADTKVLAAAK